MKSIHLLLISFQLYAMRVTAAGQEECLACVSDSDTISRITLAHINTLAEIDRLAAKKRRLQRGSGIRAWSAA